jgi:acyl-CoA thioester hydrolase
MPELHNPLPVRVYWEDTDAGGVVYYANYLKFMERARTEWLRALGVHQEALRAQEGVQFVVAGMQVRYLAPAKLDDLLTVTVSVAEQGKASMLLEQQVWRGDTLLAQGQVRVGCVDALTLTAKRLPVGVLNALQSGQV